MSTEPTDRERGKALVRVLRLARHLEAFSYVPAIDTLAAQFGVSARTIRRDLVALERAGWPVPKRRYNPWTEDVEPRRRRSRRVGV